MTVHAELQNIHDEYTRLIQAVVNNTMTKDDATRQVGALSATDARGRVWSVNIDADPTSFLVYEPGKDPVIGDPLDFMPQAESVMSPSDLLTPPASTPSMSGGMGFEPSTESFGDAFEPSPPRNATPGAPFATPPGTSQVGPAEIGGNLGRERTLAQEERGRVGGLVDKLPDGLVNKLSNNRRTVAIVGAVIMALLVLRACGGGDPATTPGEGATGTVVGAEQTAGLVYQCDPLPVAVEGVDPATEVGQLFGCLEGPEVGGAHAATYVVGESATGGYVFDAGATITRQGALAALSGIHESVGGAPAAVEVPADLSGVAQTITLQVQAAVNLGFVGADNVRPTDPLTRGDAATMLAKLLRANGVPLDAGTAAADAAGRAEDATDQAALAAKGISDTAPGTAFRFDELLTRQEFVIMFGRAIHEVQFPGSLSSSTAAAPGAAEGFGANAPATTPGAVPAGTADIAPGADVEAFVISAITSGDRALSASVINDVGDATNNAIKAARHAGFDDASMGMIATAPARITETGKAVSTFAVVDQTTNQQVLVAEAKWIFVDTQWKLTKWPSFNRPE